MSDDLGPGDVVEATTDKYAVGAMRCLARRGFRGRVERIVTRLSDEICAVCGTSPKVALVVAGLDVGPDRGWCTCGWKKIGGSKDQTVSLFANHLNTKSREKVDAS